MAVTVMTVHVLHNTGDSDANMTREGEGNESDSEDDGGGGGGGSAGGGSVSDALPYVPSWHPFV